MNAWVLSVIICSATPMMDGSYRKAKDLTKLPADELAAKFDSIDLNAVSRVPARAARANR